MSKVRQLFEDTPPPPIAVKKIKFGKRVEIEYKRNLGNGAFSEHVERCQQTEEILPEFEQALDALIPDLRYDNGLDSSLWDNCLLAEIAWKTPDLGAISSFSAKLQTHKDYSDRTRKFSVAMTSPATLSQEFQAAMEDVIVEALRFINGERLNIQGELPLGEVA